MIELTVNEKYIADLEDDFFVNEEYFFYEFLEGDPVRAFYLGLRFEEWFNELESLEKRYLYSKEARHSCEYLTDYMKQFEFWSKKFNDSCESETVDLIEMCEYILNNFIWLNEDDECLIVDLAFLLGVTTAKQIPKKDET